MNLSPDEQYDLDARVEAARDKLFHDRDRLLAIYASFDTDVLYYRLTGEFHSDYFDSLDIDALEKVAGISS
jgi:hypothetical protein